MSDNLTIEDRKRINELVRRIVSVKVIRDLRLMKTDWEFEDKGVTVFLLGLVSLLSIVLVFLYFILF